MPDSTIWFRYIFTLDNGRRRQFEVHLDPETLNIVPPPGVKEPPSWTTLEYAACAHCPLPPASRHCPIAVNIAPVVEEFGDVISCRNAEVLVETQERSFYKKGSAQETLFPLIGIYMAASGCPAMEKLKPLTRHHLPFASIEETIYRVITMYVTAQYMRMQNGLEPDWELRGITELYDTINKVNASFCERLSKAVKQDSIVNSVVILDAFAQLVKTPSKKNVAALRRIFAPYLEEQPVPPPPAG